jgi:hypothetical protein
MCFTPKKYANTHYGIFADDACSLFVVLPLCLDYLEISSFSFRMQLKMVMEILCPIVYFCNIANDK